MDSARQFNRICTEPAWWPVLFSQILCTTGTEAVHYCTSSKWAYLWHFLSALLIAVLTAGTKGNDHLARYMPSFNRWASYMRYMLCRHIYTKNSVGWLTYANSWLIQGHILECSPLLETYSNDPKKILVPRPKNILSMWLGQISGFTQGRWRTF